MNLYGNSRFTSILGSLHQRLSIVSLTRLDEIHTRFNTQTIWASYDTVPNNWTFTLDESVGLSVTPESKVRYLSYPLSGTHHVI